MRSAFLSIPALLFLATCGGDETISGYLGQSRVWQLAEIDGKRFEAAVSLTFPAKGRIGVQGACGGFEGMQEAPYPWFRAENIKMKETFCADQGPENSVIAALRRMTMAEVSGPVLILSNSAGQALVFRSDQP